MKVEGMEGAASPAPGAGRRLSRSKVGTYVQQAGMTSRQVASTVPARILLGRPVEAWASDHDPWETHVHAQDRDWVATAAVDACRPGGVMDMEYRLVGADGELVWVHDQGAFDGEALRGSLIEITPRKDLEDRLRDVEVKHRSLIEQIPAITYVDLCDDDLTSIYISPQIEWILGVLPEEYIANPNLWYEMLHPEDRERALADYLKGRAEGQPFALEYRLIGTRGQVVWFRDEAMIILDEHDRPKLVQGVMLDITHAKRAEEALRRSERQYRDLVETAQDVVFTLSSEGLLTSLNRAFETATGWPRDEWIGKPFLPLLHPEDVPIALDLVQKVQKGHAPPVFEVRINTKDGGHLVGEFSATAQYEGDRVVSFLGIARDVTARKQGEEALLLAKELAEAASRAKSEFLANMSHEIRTPLNAVIGLSGLLLDTELNREQQDFVETIRSSGDALLSVINDILDFSKIEAGRMEVDHAPFEIRACVEEALDMVTSAAAAKGLELNYLVDQEVPTTLVGDGARVRQILVNLLSNSVKFTERGEVVVTVSSRPRDERRHDVHFAVLDTGIGIPPDAMERLFGSFSQLDASITRKYGGTGLGLAISKRLAEVMGGGMWAESAVDAGSTFHFTVLAEIGDDRPKRRSDVGVLDGLRALVVDDNATNRLILTKQLRAWSMTPVEVSSGAEAIELLRGGARFDLALLDMAMSGMDGDSLAQAVRRQPTGRDLPLIMLTSLGRRQEEDPDGGPRFAAFLTKPVKPSRLHEVMAEVISASREHAEDTRATGDPSDGAGPLGERHPLRILLAEDNPVNQKVALSILRRLGYQADVAANGVEALEALERSSYDVVLMDVQMPEMDGLECARRIRRGWPDAVRPRVVAMTANAMRGDRERCFEAGMEDYVSKPIDVDQLTEALLRSRPIGVVTERGEAGMSLEDERVRPPAEDGVAPPLDRSVLEGFVEQLGADGGELVGEIVDVFLQDTPNLLADLRTAAESGDVRTLDRTAHTLKSSSASLGGLAMAARCAELEGRAHGGSLDGAMASVERIEQEYERLRGALAEARPR